MSEDIAGRDNPYDVFWDTQYRGNLAILDDWHTAMAMVMLRNGIEDINTTEPERHGRWSAPSCSRSATR